MVSSLIFSCKDAAYLVHLSLICLSVCLPISRLYFSVYTTAQHHCTLLLTFYTLLHSFSHLFKNPLRLSVIYRRYFPACQCQGSLPGCHQWSYSRPHRNPRCPWLPPQWASGCLCLPPTSLPWPTKSRLSPATAHLYPQFDSKFTCCCKLSPLGMLVRIPPEMISLMQTT